MGTLEGKVAWVTGSGRGIGKTIAHRLGLNGAKLVIHDIDQNTTLQTAEEFKKEGIETIPLVSDVSDSEAVKETVNSIVNHFGSLDILVNNAGITRDGLVLRMKDEDWDLVMKVNLKGAFVCTRGVAKVMMKQRSGKIVNIVSVVGVMGNAGQANYSASKAGMIGLTKSTAKEFASRGITANAVAPGYIETDMTAVLPEEAVESFVKGTPLGRPGSAEDVASAVAFFASPEADFITGQVLHVDGGMVM